MTAPLAAAPKPGTPEAANAPSVATPLVVIPLLDSSDLVFMVRIEIAAECFLRI
jgi:hypothetical protein